MSEMVILDVGHGNCAVLQSGDTTAVIDAPIGSLLLDTLEDMAVSSVDAAFISHADKDHLAGILSLLTSDSIAVEQIYVNPDSQRKSRIWSDFRVAVSIAERKGSCVVSTSLSSTTPGKVILGDVTIDVVAPSATLTLAGAGGNTLDGRAISANSLSAVLRIEQSDGEGVLLAGDIDEVGLDDAIAHGADLSARMLVFPHHGGLPGSGNVDHFLKKILGQVNPDSVIFSNGRNRHDNPRPEIVKAAVSHGCSISCTEMAGRCSNGPMNDAHLESIRANGRGTGSCCSGSMTVELQGGARRDTTALARFNSFVATQVPTPMCRRS